METTKAHHRAVHVLVSALLEHGFKFQNAEGHLFLSAKLNVVALLSNFCSLILTFVVGWRSANLL